MPNNAEDMKKVFENTFSIECDDALRYDLDTLEVIDITEFKESIATRQNKQITFSY